MKTTKKTTSVEPQGKSECRVIVAYEDHSTRARAMALLGHLKKRFKGDISFDVSWWKFRYLQDPEISMIARHYAAAADIVVFASDLPGLFPLSIMNWIESWTDRRSKDGGVLVPLIGSPHIPNELYSTKRFYLKHIADRAGLDHLPESMLTDKDPKIPIPILPEDIHPSLMPADNQAPSSTRINSD